MSLWPTSQSRGLWRSGDQWSFSSGPSHSAPSGSQNPSCDFFSSFRMHNWKRYTWQLAESPHWFPALWSESYFGGKGQVETMRMVST